MSSNNQERLEQLETTLAFLQPQEMEEIKAAAITYWKDHAARVDQMSAEEAVREVIADWLMPILKQLTRHDISLVGKVALRLRKLQEADEETYHQLVDPKV